MVPQPRLVGSQKTLDYPAQDELMYQTSSLFSSRLPSITSARHSEERPANSYPGIQWKLPSSREARIPTQLATD